MTNGYLCYHHHNDQGRQAVARCSKCGKALCQECAETFKSSKNGAVLCGDCRKDEVKETYVLLQKTKGIVKKELIFIFVGLVLGIVATIILANAVDPNLGVLGIWLPFVGASFGTFHKFKGKHSPNILITIIMFLVFVVISPIVFIVRIARRTKHIKQLKGYQVSLERLFSAYNGYLEEAAEQTGENYYMQLQEQKEKAQQLQKAAEQSRLAVAQKQQELEEAKKNNVSSDVLAAIQKQLDEQQRKQEEESKKAQEMAAKQAELEKKQEEQAKIQEETKKQQDAMKLDIGDVNDRLNEIKRN